MKPFSRQNFTPFRSEPWATLSELGLALLLAVGMSACVSRKTHLKAVDEAYARGQADMDKKCAEMFRESTALLKEKIRAFNQVYGENKFRALAAQEGEQK